MKKKTFIVQLLDSKNPSRKSFTQVEDANFYSNDTDASLVFIPHEDTFEFQSAKVVMYNRGDESLVERDAIVTTENGRKVASYELPAEIIAHWGDWTAQPVFTSGGEIYSGSIVPFSVIRYLMHERPPRLTEIVTVTEFIEQSQALVDDMEQAEAQRASAESSRLSAETQRLSAETVRVSAEAQRVTDHANRSAELDSKADKVVLKNLVKNGNFSDGGQGWLIGTNITNITFGDNYVEFEGVGQASNSGSNWVSHRPSVMPDKDDVLYIYSLATRISGEGIVTIGAGYATFATDIPLNDKTLISYREVPVYPPNGNSRQVVISADIGVMVRFEPITYLNLTRTFGAGNEPTKEEMDELIKVTGYIDGEYALNNKEMLGHLMKVIHEKANKKQEDWITPTLLNGWEQHSLYDDVGYYKDDFGVVHLKGSVANGGANRSIFTLPAGYRPRKYAFYPVLTNVNGGNTLGSVYVEFTGKVHSYQTGSNITLNHISFRAEK